MKDRLFSILQRLGKSFMLPIAILPVAGLLLSIGTTFTNQTMLDTLHLSNILSKGSLLYFLFTIMARVGQSVFQNLPLLFACGVALGMAKKEKGTAVISAVLAFIVMHTTINAMLMFDGSVLANQSISPNVLQGTIVSVCGTLSLEMGVFGGIIVGLGVSYLHNHFYRIQLPNTLSFFGGVRFVPIISTLVFLLVGILMYFVWPYVQSSIYALGQGVSHSGYVGTFLFGIIKRLLVPFGLHHVFYLPFWQSAIGGSMVVNDVLISGGQNIFFAQLADPNTIHFSSEATKYFTGEFIFMIFGLPGAALAMYQCSRLENKKLAGGLLFSAALTSILTGITEPIEFSFLFVAPALFGVQVLLAGSAYMIAHIFNIAVGLTFSGGIIDLIMFGVLQGNEKTNWILIIPIGIIYFILYYTIFKYLIKKLNLKTLGRGSHEELLALGEHENIQQDSNNVHDEQSLLIIQGLGGNDNFSDLDCCITRLRATIHDTSKINESILKQSGAAGILMRGNSIQIIYGPQASIIKSKLEDTVLLMPKQSINEVNLLNKTSKMVELNCIVEGEVFDISESNDELFALGKMGDGVMIKPSNGLVVAPCDATITMIFPTQHAIGMKLDNGCELLLHFGVNTVSLNGQGFEVLVHSNQQIKKGDVIMNVDLKYIHDQNLNDDIMLVITHLPQELHMKKIYGKMTTGNKVIDIF